MRAYEYTTTEAYPRILGMLKRTSRQPSRNGDTREHLGVTVQSGNPRDRMFIRDGFNLAFCLQEAVAYWTGQNPGHVQRYNSNMKQFMTDGELEGSAYGRYLRRIPHDQVVRVIDQLRDNPTTRQAVINFHQADVENYDGKDVACTIYMQFMIRNGQLHAFANMRSQDMYWGYPYDVHNFQWLQEVLAGILGVRVGTYTHYMNSCHYYVDREEQVLNSSTGTPICFPDIRLPEDELDVVMDDLTDGLEAARNNTVPRVQIESIARYSQFYADWLCYMTAYEQYRFHDDPTVAEKVAQWIEFDRFRWHIQERMNDD